MNTKPTEILKFENIINCAEDVYSQFYSDDKNENDIMNKMTVIFDYVMDCASVTDEIKQAYDSIHNVIFECINNHVNIDSEYEYYYKISKLALAMIYRVLNPDFQSYAYQNDEAQCTKHILDFFKPDIPALIKAHFTAARTLAFSDPMLCYECTIKDFEMMPDLMSSMYSEVNYVYSPEKINEEIHKVCPICGESKEIKPFFCANMAFCNDNKFSPAKLWMKCEACGNLYSYNFPDQGVGNINGHYTKKNENKILTPRHLLAAYSRIFNNIRQFNTNNKYLEIGIGNGEMLAVALEMGYDVSAIEICKEDCENISSALGIDIIWNNFLKHDTNDLFDVIIMGDVLEHVTNPISALKKAYSLLDKNGILWLSTPNFESSFTRMRKFKDAMWYQKNHFTYFSYNGLKPFLDEIGFEIKRYDVCERYNGSMELILQKI